MAKSLQQEMHPAQDVLSFLRDIIKEHLPRERKLYSTQLVCWLMISQFLNEVHSLSDAVRKSLEATSQELVGNCKRKRFAKQSLKTGAISQARFKIPLESFQLVLSKLLEQIKGKQLLWNQRRVFSIDGTSISTAPTPEFRRNYPASNNGHGESPFPKIRLCVAHDLYTGIAEEPEWDAMYGDDNAGEIEQTLRILARLPLNSIVISDQAHGIFRTVWSATQAAHDVVYRLTEQRGKVLLKKLGLELSKDFHIDAEVTWTPSVDEQEKYLDIPQDAAVKGRIIVANLVLDKKKIQIILFTTLVLVSKTEILKLYKKRWEIEGEIRDLKKTLYLDKLTARKIETLEKEILSAIIAYNTVRAVILLAAKEHKVQDPKRISFINALKIIKEQTPNLLQSKNLKEAKIVVDRMLRYMALTINPKRNRKSYPRTVYKRRLRYPPKKMPMITTSSNEN